MIEQIFRVTVNSEVITHKVSVCSISEQMQRIYNTASFESEDNIIAESIIKIELGDKVFDGFIYSSTKNGNNKYSIECRTFGGYMTTPFIADDTSIVIPVKTSHELCAYYAAEYGIPIIITAIDLDFGGDYEQKGTPLSALVAVANTTGADYWFDGTSIRIEPAKWIEEQGEEILSTEIFDYIPFAKTIEQRGVGTVVVGASDSVSSTDTNKTISMSCSSEIDGCNAKATIRVIPHSAYQYSKGLSGIVPVNTPLDYVGMLSMQSYLTLKADIVSINVALTPETYHLIDERRLKLMKRNAVLINTARGSVVDEKALIKALKEGWIAGAGLDVFEKEPISLDDPLLKLDNVVLAPHMGSATVETRRAMARTAIKNIMAVLKGEVPPNPVPEQRGKVFQKS